MEVSTERRARKLVDILESGGSDYFLTASSPLAGRW
jgi:hypothetical protein